MISENRKARFLSGVHPAWIVLAGCSLLFFCTTGLIANANAAYQPYIRNLNGFTNAQTSTLMTIRNLSAFVATLCILGYYRRLSLRYGMALAGLFAAASLAVFGFARSYPVYCAASLLSGLAFGFGSMIPVAILFEHWFLSRRTLAIGLCSASSGIATVGIPSLIASSVERHGLSATFFGECAVTCVLVALGFMLVRDRPDGIRTFPFGTAAGNETAQPPENRAGISGQDWLALVPAMFMVGALTSVGYGHQTLLAVSDGFSERVAALTVTASGFMLLIGKAAFGALAEWRTTYRANRVFGAILLASLFLYSLPIRSAAVLLAASALYGVGLSMTAVGVSVWAGDLSSPEEYDRNVRRFQICYSAGYLLFASVPGILADASGGSFLPAYRLFLAFAACSMVIIQSMYRRLKKRNEEKT